MRASRMIGQLAPLILASWIFTVTPPVGQTIDVGPYNSQYGCRDWLGSALYLHGPKCHVHPTAKNCVPIGNGYAYPGQASVDCTAVNEPLLNPGYGYFLYPDDGGVWIITHKPRWSYARCEHHRKRELGGTVGNDCFFQGNTRE